jgi:hypothetical protein
VNSRRKHIYRVVRPEARQANDRRIVTCLHWDETVHRGSPWRIHRRVDAVVARMGLQIGAMPMAERLESCSFRFFAVRTRAVHNEDPVH